MSCFTCWHGYISWVLVTLCNRGSSGSLLLHLTGVDSLELDRWGGGRGITGMTGVCAGHFSVFVLSSDWDWDWDLGLGTGTWDLGIE